MHYGPKKQPGQKRRSGNVIYLLRKELVKILSEGFEKMVEGALGKVGRSLVID